MLSPLDTVREYLCSDFYYRFSVGDTFALHFEKCILVAQDVSIQNAEQIDASIHQVLPEITKTVDRADVAKATVLAVTQRISLVSVELGARSSLILTFENGITLIFPTDTDIVDWQWALTQSGGDPYDPSEFVAGVFFETLETKTNSEQDGGGQPATRSKSK